MVLSCRCSAAGCCWLEAAIDKRSIDEDPRQLEEEEKEVRSRGVDINGGAGSLGSHSRDSLRLGR